MTESEFNQQVEQILRRVADAIDDSGEDVECEMMGSGILEIEFEDGSKIIINRQGAVQEIWVAAKSGGFHYRWQDGEWRDTRSGEELLAALSALITLQGGVAIPLK